jgi:hypothetical protein
MKTLATTFKTLLLTLISFNIINAQNVGVATNSPDAPFHVASSGQVLTPGGLMLLGSRAEVHLELDFNRIQSLSTVNANPTSLHIQPDGGDVGIGTDNPFSRLHVAGTTDQFLTLHKTNAGSGQVGIDLLRSSEFSATDWRIVNDGGTLEFLDATNNFTGAADLNMIITQSGNVGLGTDSPSSHLHVAGDADQFIKVHRTTGGAGMAGIDLLRDTEFSGTDWRIVNDGGKLQFLDAGNNFTGAADLNMTINQGGNVGIGIENAHSKLHVNGTEGVGETGDGFFQVGNPSGLHLRFDGNEILARNNDSPSLLYFQYWSGSLSLCYDDSGRVGIGTSNPVAKVQITDGDDVNLGSGGELVLGETTTTNLAMDGNEIQARNNGSAAPLYIQAGGGDVLFSPSENGQVGIGITSAANMPDNDYLLAVDGKIIVEEVRVEVSGSWPDYVFNNDYALTPLNILENEIKEKGHLPGIPSAEEVEANGFDLGDMQKRMMEKVEELTLYVIELKKEIEALKKERN